MTEGKTSLTLGSNLGYLLSIDGRSGKLFSFITGGPTAKLRPLPKAMKPAWAKQLTQLPRLKPPEPNANEVAPRRSARLDQE